MQHPFQGCSDEYSRNDTRVTLITGVRHGAGAEQIAGLVITLTRQDPVHVKCQTQSWALGQGTVDVSCSSNHLCNGRMKLLLSLLSFYHHLLSRQYSSMEVARGVRVRR